MAHGVQGVQGVQCTGGGEGGVVRGSSVEAMSAVYSVQCTVYGVQCTVYNVR